MRRRVRGISVWLALLAVAFALGVVAGSLAVGFLPNEERGAAASRLGAALDRLQHGGGSSAGEVARRSAAFNVRTALLLWLLGLSAWGIPGVVAVVFARGFIVGFAVSFLAEEQGWRGLLFAAAALLPSHLIVVPLLLGLGTVAIAFALYRREARGRGGRLAGELGRYTALVAALTALLALGGVLDGYAGRALASYVLGLARTLPTLALRGWSPLVYSS